MDSLIKFYGHHINSNKHNFSQQKMCVCVCVKTGGGGGGGGRELWIENLKERKGDKQLK